MFQLAFKPSRPGFTLVELLISAGLVGVVLGLAMKGFAESKKISDLTRSKVIATEEANLGVQKVAKILKRCHIIFFDARPLVNQTGAGTPAMAEAAVGATENTVRTMVENTVPSLLTTLGNGASQVSWNDTQNDAPLSLASAGATTSRGNFRFRSINGSVGLHGNDPSSTLLAAAAVDKDGWKVPIRYFQSPLLYAAEANFNGGDNTATVQADTGIPMSWNIYVLYLAPMSFTSPRDDGHALFPIRGTTPLAMRDKAKQRSNPALTYYRTTIPLELRLLTIPDVSALVTPGAAPPATGLNPFGRLSVNPVAGVTQDVRIRPVPYDAAPNNINFDPVPYAANAATYNELTTNSPGGWAATGARVQGALHGNYGNVGNDPPTNPALGTQAHWNGTAFGGTVDAATDVVIARYIDPDATDGTYVRIMLDGDWATRIGDAGTLMPAALRPPGGRFTSVPAFAGPQRFMSSLTTPPRRAALSVTTRFRTTRQIPFQFATETVEVDLETLKRFQAFDRKSL